MKNKITGQNLLNLLNLNNFNKYEQEYFMDETEKEKQVEKLREEREKKE